MGILCFLGKKHKEFKSQRARPSPLQSTSLQWSKCAPGSLQKQNNAANIWMLMTELWPINSLRGQPPLGLSLASLFLFLLRSPTELDANGNQPQGSSLSLNHPPCQLPSISSLLAQAANHLLGPTTAQPYYNTWYGVCSIEIPQHHELLEDMDTFIFISIPKT